MTRETKMQWTPGPWFAVNQNTPKEPMITVMAARIAGQKPRHEVAICATGDSPQEMENANAHLIAAAPDLYVALVGMVKAFSCEIIMAGNDKLEPEDPAIVVALAALACARGEYQ
jgi:hypothetical protein